MADEVVANGERGDKNGGSRDSQNDGDGIDLIMFKLVGLAANINPGVSSDAN